MINLQDDQRTEAAFLFEGIQDSMVISYLQGYAGEGYVDRWPDPNYGWIVSGEYCFFGGDAEAAKEDLKGIFDQIPGDKSTAIFADHKWLTALLATKELRPEKVDRYGIVQKDYAFDEDFLTGLAADLPEGYALQRFDEDIYDQALAEDWSEEFCKTFASATEFLKQGFGMAVMKEGKLVAGTSTMTVYDGGCEIELATHPKHRRKGLAKACAAAFLLEAQRRGIRACWDAANTTSLHIATTLGYEDGGTYPTVKLHRPQRVG